MTAETWTATLPDGTQVLIDRWSDESLTLATRERPSDVWSPPVDAERAA